MMGQERMCMEETTIGLLGLLNVRGRSRVQNEWVPVALLCKIIVLLAILNHFM